MSNPFQIIVGEQLSSVIFVQDYLQLDFDGLLLTCYVWPEIRQIGCGFNFPHDNYRNVLCSLIGHQVEDAVYKPEVSLEILFGIKGVIYFNFEKAQRESIFFTSNKGEWFSV